METDAVTPEILAVPVATEGPVTGAIADPGVDAAYRLAARLAELNLDPETLELVLAALASDVCDHVGVDTADPSADR